MFCDPLPFVIIPLSLQKAHVLPLLAFLTTCEILGWVEGWSSDPHQPPYVLTHLLCLFQEVKTTILYSLAILTRDISHWYKIKAYNSLSPSETNFCSRMIINGLNICRVNNTKQNITLRSFIETSGFFPLGFYWILIFTSGRKRTLCKNTLFSLPPFILNNTKLF